MKSSASALNCVRGAKQIGCSPLPPPASTSEQVGSDIWHSHSAEDVLAQLDSSETGLTAQEAAQRLAAHGPNELQEGPRASALRILAGQFKSLIIWILIAADVIAAVMGDAVDAIAIFAIVVLNAVIGFYQEFSAEKSLDALKKMTAPGAKVRRDGKSLPFPPLESVRATSSNWRPATLSPRMPGFSKPPRSRALSLP